MNPSSTSATPTVLPPAPQLPSTRLCNSCRSRQLLFKGFPLTPYSMIAQGSNWSLVDRSWHRSCIFPVSQPPQRPHRTRAAARSTFDTLIPRGFAHLLAFRAHFQIQFTSFPLLFWRLADQIASIGPRPPPAAAFADGVNSSPLARSSSSPSCRETRHLPATGPGRNCGRQKKPRREPWFETRQHPAVLRREKRLLHRHRCADSRSPVISFA